MLKKALIVEDSSLLAKMYSAVFAFYPGCQMLFAANGLEGLEKLALEKGAIDVIILDINMPGMDGLQTLARIHDLNPRLPVILNSAYAEYKDQFVSWIADAYVIKSSDPKELKDAVRRVLARRALRKKRKR